MILITYLSSSVQSFPQQYVMTQDQFNSLPMVWIDEFIEAENESLKDQGKSWFDIPKVFLEDTMLKKTFDDIIDGKFRKLNDLLQNKEVVNITQAFIVFVD